MLLKIWTRLACVAAAVAVLSVPFFLLQSSWPFWRRYGIGSLVETEWYPYEHLYGMLPAVAGSFWVLLLALAVAVPGGLAAALAGSEILGARHRGIARLGMELLAGVPSIVYGLLGLWLLLPALHSGLGLLTGHSLLAAGLLLSVMILPTITLMAMDAFQRVPAEHREAARNLGMPWEWRLWRVLLPQAWPGIRSAVLLAVGRALGETMAVMLVVGSMDRMPRPWYNLLQPAQTLTSRIGREISEAAFGSEHFAALMACGLLLAVATVLASVLAHASPRRTSQ